MNSRILLLSVLSLLTLTLINSEPLFNSKQNLNTPVVIQQVALDGNNINAWIINTGIFDQDKRTSNTPGFEWPKGTNQDAIFTTGLTIAAVVNNVLCMAAASYSGEYVPGHVILVQGNPVAQTDSSFHLYKVKRGDNQNNNPDWLNWGQMVPYGAPFIDVNHNNIYEPAIDTPGVANAVQTIFVCITDGFPSSHTPSEGFGGGTAPLFAELHMTAWCYNNPGYEDMQFVRWDVINKNNTAWNSSYFSIVSDPDLGCPDDDYIGCDTSRSLGFCYNSQDVDCSGTHRYTGIVPAVGIKWLSTSLQQNLKLTAFTYFTNPGSGGPPCERDPNPGVLPAYNYMKGIKSDSTPWVVPPGGPQNVTKFTYTGDPETGTGWNEGLPGYIHGSTQNCGGPNVYTGVYINVNPGGDRRFVMSSGSDNYTVNPGDTNKIYMVQLIARGTSRLNSVTKLKQLADYAQEFFLGGFVIGLHNEQNSANHTFRVFHNYPNPFNPTTVIRYDLQAKSFVTLTVYNSLGEKVATLVNENQNAGEYKVAWDGSNFPSGVYFYKFTAGDYTRTNKMILLK